MRSCVQQRLPAARTLLHRQWRHASGHFCCHEFHLVGRARKAGSFQDAQGAAWGQEDKGAASAPGGCTATSAGTHGALDSQARHNTLRSGRVLRVQSPQRAHGVQGGMRLGESMSLVGSDLRRWHPKDVHPSRARRPQPRWHHARAGSRKYLRDTLQRPCLSQRILQRLGVQRTTALGRVQHACAGSRQVGSGPSGVHRGDSRCQGQGRGQGAPAPVRGPRLTTSTRNTILRTCQRGQRQRGRAASLLCRQLLTVGQLPQHTRHSSCMGRVRGCGA